MTIKITVGISCVDGAEETIQTTELERARGFLKERDHEGSTVHVQVSFEADNEMAFNLLRVFDETPAIHEVVGMLGLGR